MQLAGGGNAALGHVHHPRGIGVGGEGRGLLIGKMGESIRQICRFAYILVRSVPTPRHVRHARLDVRPLAFGQVPPMQVRADDERQAFFLRWV